MRLSLFDWDGLGEKTWVGLGNFVELFDDDAFYTSLHNNILWLVLYMLAVPAHHHGVPFHVAAPRTTIDPATRTTASASHGQRRRNSRTPSAPSATAGPARNATTAISDTASDTDVLGHPGHPVQSSASSATSSIEVARG